MADKILKQDGSEYLFHPGKDGSLTDLRKRPMKPLYSPLPRVAKVVPILKSMRSKKRAAVDTGSSRG